MFDILYINVGHAQEPGKVVCHDICQQSTVGIFPKHLSIDKKHPRILLLAKWLKITITTSVTQLLVSHFSGSAEITATDINAEMLAFAQEKITAPNVGWDTVDMTAIPYEQELFDTVVCQFGLMFATDTTLLSRFFPNNMPNPAFGPFSMADESYGLALLQQAGFTRYKVEPVSKTGICNTASNAAIGFILGTPLYNLIKNDPSLIQRFENALEEAIALELGKAPIHSPLRSLVYSAEK